MRAAAFLLLLMAMRATASGVEAPATPVTALNLPTGWSAALRGAEVIQPGREAPATTAHEGVIEFSWNSYRTVIVIAPGSGTLRLGYVLTFQDGGDLQVAYRAAIYRDRHGVLHADARNALITGPVSAQWSPDSFAIFASGQVVTLDDHGSSEHGSVVRLIDPTDAAEYTKALHRAETLVDDGT